MLWARCERSHSVASLSPYPRNRMGILPEPSLCFLLAVCVEKKEELGLQVSIVNKLSQSLVKSMPENINIGTYFFVLQRVSSCLPPSTCTLTHTHAHLSFFVPVFVSICDIKMHPASVSRHFHQGCIYRPILQHALHLHSS